MQLSIAWLALRGIMVRMSMRQEGGFYAMKQHTDSREPGIGGEVFKEHHTDSREPGIGEELLKLRSAFFSSTAQMLPTSMVAMIIMSMRMF